MKKTTTTGLPLKWQQGLTTMLLFALLMLGNIRELRAQYFQVAQCSGTPSGGLGSNNYGPMNSIATANATNRTAVIYPASQLSGISGVPVSALYFYRFSSTAAMAGTPNLKIYLKEVSAIDWGASSVTWATEIATATLVYDGNPSTIVGTTSGWKAFPCISNFNYSGTQNLAVFFEYAQTTASASAITWTYEYTGSCINTSNSNTTKYINNTSGTPGATLSSSDYRRPYIGFDAVLSCYPPTALTPGAATTTTANISWTAPAAPPANGYEYYLNTTGIAPTAATPATGSTGAGVTNAVLAVSPGNTYSVWVRSVCTLADKSPWSAPATISSVPANDDAPGAIALTVNGDFNCGSTTTGTTFGATQSAEAAPSCSATGINDDVWYSFVATATAHRISFSGVSTGTMVAALYSGTPGSLSFITGACASTTLNATGLTAGTTYYVRAYNTVATATTRSNFSICVGTAPPPPANDEASGAIALTANANNGCAITTNGTTISATQSAEAAPTCSATGINDDVWYTFTASATSHRIAFSNVTTGTMVAALYSGTPGSLSFITGACASTTLFADGLTPGTTYYVRAYTTVATVTTVTNFTICLSSPPVNNDCAGATALTVNTNLACGVTAAGSTTGATESAGTAPTCSATGINDDIWYSFVATNSMHVISITGATNTTASQVYSGTCGSLTALVCGSTSSGDLSQLVTGLTPGSTYYIRAYSTSATAGTFTDFTICVGTPPPPPVNDNCSGATALTPSATATCTGTAGITDWASQSTDVAPSCSGTGINDDVWYSFVASNVDHTINISGASNTTGTAVYTGSCGALSQIPNACVTTSSGASSLTVGSLIPGNTYYVRVYSTSTTTTTFSSFSICVITPPVPSCPALSAPAAAAAVNGTPTLTWGTTTNAAAYDVYLDGNTIPTTLYAANVTATSYTITTLLPVGTYYWYVVAKNAAGTSTGCDANTRSFVVSAPPANDLPVNAVTIAVNAACTGNPFTNANATQVAGEPWTSCVGAGGFKSVWYKFDAPASGAVKITNDFTATLGDSRLALYSASDASNFSTFNIIGCDDDNGVTSATKSVIYATGLTPSQTYYVVVDGLNGSTASGAFCLEVLEMTSAMISTTSTCSTAGQGAPALGTYTGWTSITSSTGLLVANVKRNTAGNTGTTEYSYGNAHNINTAAVRSDATGLKYMDRNYRITIGAGAPASTYDVRLFFLSSELTNYTTAGGTATLGTLGVTRQTGEAACNNDFSAANGAASFIGQDANGTLAGGAISWIEIETPGFSNFFMNAGPVALPVDLTFNGKNDGPVNNLNWVTTREQNFSHFELQRSADGIAFSKLAVIDAKGVTTGSKYAYTDDRPFEGLNIYRLSLVDKDGKSTLSNSVKLVTKSGNGLSLHVYPNPVKQQLQVAITGKLDGKGVIQVIDITGKVLQSMPVSGNNATVDMSAYTSGMYMIRYTDNTHNTVLKVNKN